MRGYMEKWPRENCDFFRVDCEKNEKIKIVSCGNLDKDFFEYASNFLEAANVVVYEMLDSGDIATLDVDFFNLAFFYRHSLELILKAIGFQHIKGKEEREKFLNDTFHNLSKILKYIEPYISEYIEYDKESYEWLVEFFHDINDLDKDSDCFRYPFKIKKNGKGYYTERFFKDQTHINLIKFCDKMNSVFDILKDYYYKNKVNNIINLLYYPTFIEEGGSYYEQSVVGYKLFLGEFYCSVNSYINVSRILYRYMILNDDKKEKLFLPYCYSCRNAIELCLKNILYEESSFSYNEALNIMKKSKHGLTFLWKQIKDDINKHTGHFNESKKILKYAENYILKLNDFDGSADIFRYPTDKHLNCYFKKVKCFDLENVRDYFEDVMSFLDCTISLMDEQNKCLRDSAYEYSQY
ncbi:TPA: hypothetical protein ACY4SO_001934 [Clostridium perfringens]